MKNYLPLSLIGIFGILEPVWAVGKTTVERETPNFIIILADDLGYGDLSYNGSKQIKTPYIDQLAAEGIQFTQGYVSAPVCSPSRAGLLTGRNQVTFGHDNNLGENQPGFDPQFLGLPLTEKTIADYLKPLGYVSGLVGKWHLGTQAWFHPLKRGFDEFWGYTGGGHDYFKVGKDIECNYKTPQPITYLTDDKGDECVDFIRRHKKQPFFLFASFNAPHTPLQALDEDIELFRNIEDKKRRTYCAMVHRLDLNVGKIMKAVKEEGLEKNTVIVFLSDNGGPVNVTNAVNAPLNGQKGCLLEGGIRVPFIIRWKGKLPSGKKYDNPVISLDLAPTFIALAGGEITSAKKFDGTNLMPYLLGEKLAAPHDTMLWRFTINAAIREGEWKLIRLPDRLPMLFNMVNDVSEQHDVASENPDKTRQLLKTLGQWDVRLPHPLFLEGSEWKKLQLDLYDRNCPLTQPE